MKKFYTLIFLLVGLVYNHAQIIIQCPEDQQVHLFDLDETFTSYGEPAVSSQESFTIDNNITVVDGNGGCDRYAIIRYTATEASGGSAWCEQRITIDLPLLTDITFPEDYTELTGLTGDTEPEVAGFPEPSEFLNGESNIFAAYQDQVLSNSTGVKIIRTWTLLDWCKGETLTHTQIISIDNLLDGRPRLFNVLSCNGSVVTVSDLEVTTTQSAFTVDQSACTFDINTSLADYLNCLAENNDIDQAESFIVDLNTEDEDYLNGVSTLDMVMSQRHILGIDQITEFCSLTAGDVNADGKVSALDILLMRKLILGVDDTFDIPSWLFFNSNILDENAASSDQDLIFQKSEFPLQEVDIIAVKVGDLNGSAADN